MSIEQRINLKFFVHLGKTPIEALKLLQEVYGDDTMSRTRLFEWHRRFKEVREEVEDDHRSGRPSTSRTDRNVEGVGQKLWSDRCLTVRMIADDLGMNSERVWRIIAEDLEIRKICTKIVPSLLNEGQKEQRVQVCQDILEQLEIEPYLLKRVVTGDESMDLRVRSTHQTAEPWMEERIATKTQKGEGVQVQNQGDDDRFFWCPKNCPRRIFGTRPNY